MKKIFLIIIILLLFSAGWAHGMDKAGQILSAVEKKYAGLKDYQADINVHFDIEVLQSPDMQARLFYKAPDKMIVKSERIFFFPKDGGYFNPSLFKKENSDAKILKYLVYEGKKAVKLRLTPKDPAKVNQNFILTIDTDRTLIRQVESMSPEKKEVKASIDYIGIGTFDLPNRILLHIDMPPAEPSGMREFTQFGQKEKNITGTIEIRYSNYKVNTGLPDDLFKQANQPK